jgi:hypothetical protein
MKKTWCRKSRVRLPLMSNVKWMSYKTTRSLPANEMLEIGFKSRLSKNHLLNGIVCTLGTALNFNFKMFHFGRRSPMERKPYQSLSIEKNCRQNRLKRPKHFTLYFLCMLCWFSRSFKSFSLTYTSIFSVKIAALGSLKRWKYFHNKLVISKGQDKLWV